MDVEELVRRLYESYQERDWSQATKLLHVDARLDMPATDEHLSGRAQLLALARNYPEPWGDLRVLRTLGGADSAVAEVEIEAVDDVYRCAAFWVVHEGLLHTGVEYWVTVGGERPSPERRPTGL